MANISDFRRRVQNCINRNSQAFIRTEAINTSGTSYSVAAVDTSQNYFQVNDTDLSGDANFDPGQKIYINGSTGNDAIFEVDSVTTGDFDNEADGTDSRIHTVESIEDSTADGTLYVDKDYTYQNFGRIKEASIEPQTVDSDPDQDGRVSSNLLGLTISFTLQQGSNVELSRIPDLARPPLDGDDGANFVNYNRGYDFYANGHFVYFSGDNQLTTATLNAAVQDDTDATKDGKLLTTDTTKDLYDDQNGFLFQNVLLNPGPSLGLSGGQNVIAVEFNVEVEFDQLDSLDTDRKITVSPSNYYNYV